VGELQVVIVVVGIHPYRSRAGHDEACHGGLVRIAGEDDVSCGPATVRSATWTLFELPLVENSVCFAPNRLGVELLARVAQRAGDPQTAEVAQRIPPTRAR
jgi:hypothetical protein